MIARSILPFLCLTLTLTACGGKSDTGGGPPGENRRGSGPPNRESGSAAAVPVKVQPVVRQSISEFLEANGTLEAENEIDLVARATGPIATIEVEEGDPVRSGQLLARIDDREARNQVAISTVNRDEAKRTFDRTEASFRSGLVSQEVYDTALSSLQGTEAQLETSAIQLAYTEIRAPFDALVASRDIRLAQFVNQGTVLFRISDFTPLLCPIEVPEKDLSRFRVGQPGRVQVEAFPEETFEAKVLRVRPTVDAGTGTVTVTLEVQAKNRLRPGMFARVFLQTETHDNVLVIPREALVLDSIGDTVFIRENDIAVRREVQLGIREENNVEVLAGLSEGEEIVVLGQEGLVDGTPVSVLEEGRPASAPSTGGAAPSNRSPEQIEAMRQRMKERGMSDEDIEARLQQMQSGGGRQSGQGPRGGEGGIPLMMQQRIRDASPEEIDGIKERMRQFGMSDERIEEVVTSIRGKKPNS